MVYQQGSARTSHLRTSRIIGLLLLWGASVAVAQLPTATILGVVRDSTGAVVPGTPLTARNVETGQTRTSVAGEDGSYRFSALPVGNYEVRAEQPGFRSQLRSGLTLAVGQEAVVNFTLEVGAIEQTIEVTAEAPLVNTTTGSLGGLVDEQRMADLPLNGRNYIDLTLLQPGIQQHKNVNYGAGLTGTYFSSNGAPVRSNNYLLDGALMVNAYGASSASATGQTLGVEGIREYRVVTNSFSAEYGMTMGSQMVIVSKSGTNSFHGSLFEYLRNSVLDARNYFDRKTAFDPPDRRLPPFKRNNFGGSIGGPIQKDKTFFHLVYEGVRERLGLTNILNVIPSSAKVDGGLVPQISPVTKPWLALYPDPNLPNNQYTAPFSQPSTENYGQTRVDHTLSENDTLFGRYTVDDGQQVTPTQGNAAFALSSRSRAQFTTLSENHVFSPTVINTFRFSFSRTKIALDSIQPPTGPEFSLMPGEPLGYITVGGIMDLGADRNIPILHKQNVFTWSDDLFATRGRHLLKMGTLVNRYQQYLETNSYLRGGVGFANLPDFLRAQPSFYLAVTPGSVMTRSFRYTTLGFYLQDDVRVSPTFTLNLGLRYEFNTQVREVRGIEAAIRDLQHDAQPTLGPVMQNSSLRNFSPRFGFAWDVTGNGRTAVRGGFGMPYDIGNLGSALFIAIQGTPPFSSQSRVDIPPPITLRLPLFFSPASVGKSPRIVDYLMQQPHMLQYNLTVERQLPFDMSLTLAYAGSRGINLMQIKEGNPTVPQVLPDGRLFWTGNESRTNPNWDSATLMTAGGNSWYNSLQFGVLKRLSKGLQFQSSYTWSKVLDETQNQTPADRNGVPVDSTHRELDKGPAEFDLTHTWRFNAIYRLPELAPSGGFLGKVLNGWWVSNILSIESGYGFSPIVTGDRARKKSGGATAEDRPDLVPGRSNDNITRGVTAGCLGVSPGQKLGGPDRYYDPCAFTIPAAGFLGTAGRNILRGPGLANLDFSLAKDTPLPFLGESGKLEFRAEFFNILNRANFSTPRAGPNEAARRLFAGRADVEPPLGAAGRLVATSTTSRQVQFALKIVF